MDAAFERRRFTAAMTAHLMNSTGNYKKPITGDQLLGVVAEAEPLSLKAPRMPAHEPRVIRG